MSIVSLEELQAKSAFVRRVAETGCVFAVEGLEGAARVRSPRRSSKQVELIWSERAEAERWADALVKAPRVAVLPLSDFLSAHLPRLDIDGHLIGGNWSDDPVEPEFTAAELNQRVRRALVDRMADIAIKTRQVWILKGGELPATLVTRHPAGSEALPVFADRQAAEAAISGAWAHTAPVRVPLGDFLQKTIVWCIETRRRIAPAYIPGPGLIEMAPWDAKALLSGHPPTRQVA